jgi:3-oxoacyl-[acyl-carrier protein] reductase
MVLETQLKGAHIMITGKTGHSPRSYNPLPLTINSGGSRGMGEAFVRAFLNEEANVSYCSRSATGHEFDDFVKSLPESNKARAYGTAVDVGSKEALVEWVNKSAEREGKIDTIIANGIYRLAHTLTEASE